MNIRKTVKKIAALAAGTTMIGATIMGATALDLSDYPAPFVSDGVFDGKIVVGANAATSDVVGAIDLAASLQADATTTTEVEIPGAVGETTISGDSAKFQTGSDVVRFGETIGSVKSTFIASDLDALKEGTFDTGLGSTPVKQYLKFDNTTASIVYEEDDEDVVTNFLKFADDSYMFEYHLEFTEGAVSEIGSSNELDDLEGEVITMLGAPYTIVEGKRGAGNSIELTMLGGEVADVLRDGETKTYTIDGVDYEVTAVFIDSSSTQSAKLSVNGILTKELGEGDTEILGGDVTIGIQDILTNNREGLVEFYLGASKIKLTDSDYATNTYAQGTVKVGTETIDDAYLIVSATNQTSNTELKVNYIKYKVKADDDIYIPAGEGLRAALREPESMLTDTWDIYYAGFIDTDDTIIKFNSKSDHSYEIEFENVHGETYKFPFVTNEDGTYKWGDDDDHIVFQEPNFTSAATSGADNLTFISDDDYFIVSDRATNLNTEDKAVVSVMRYQSISDNENLITFRDLAGDTMSVSYTGTEGTTATGDLIVAGKAHKFYVGAGGTGEEKYALAMDLDGDTTIDADEVQLVTIGGAIIDLGTQAYSNLSLVPGPDALSAAVTVNITTPASRFDEAGDGPESSIVSLQNATSNEMTLSVTSPSLVDDPDNDDWSRAYTNYGAFFELYSPTSGSAIPELTINYPLVQRSAEVFVTAGTVEVHEGAASGSGTYESTELNPIAVGLAVLDTNAPAIGTEPMIVVGGPCANTVAAELMGNPENCAEGFEPGKAIIKLWSDQNAMLVAGYEAQETLGACYVLADYEDYDLTGTEAEVVVADLSSITVNPVEAEE